MTHHLSAGGDDEKFDSCPRIGSFELFVAKNTFKIDSVLLVSHDIFIRHKARSILL